ncbi:hypothetical protein [Nonomuraea endophytica]|uniref:Uncharacterized protein n=1 Tax=Nonomuraea endophytica TaxID=714136 RepID=A0A7W8A9M5_9ACTN|nr:hypothetical protein [Nonomuraea endophytica]MBB5082138.1 hypothetical protein [Nonomuraea endophytica]
MQPLPHMAAVARTGLVTGLISTVPAVALLVVALTADPRSGIGYLYFLAPMITPFAFLVGLVMLAARGGARHAGGAVAGSVLIVLVAYAVTALMTDEPRTMLTFFVLPLGAAALFPLAFVTGVWLVRAPRGG